jgi:hypothetical protein
MQDRERSRCALEVFRALDKNQDGEISQADILVLAHQFGVSWREARRVLATLLSAADQNEDGSLQPEEWVRIMLTGPLLPSLTAFLSQIAYFSTLTAGIMGQDYQDLCIQLVKHIRISQQPVAWYTYKSVARTHSEFNDHVFAGPVQTNTCANGFCNWWLFWR